MKNKLLEKILPKIKPARELVQERDEVIKRTGEAEANACKAVEAEMKLLQADNRRLRDENLKLTELAQSTCPNPIDLRIFSLYVS